MQHPSVSVENHHTSWEFGPRLRAAGIHLTLSVLVATVSGLLVFALWYPYPYREISGGRELFQLMVTVDVVLGPLLTFAVFNRAKPRRELRRDLAIIVLLQLTGLTYGLWTVHMARPVHMVFEYDRFRVVHQIEIPAELEDKAPAGIAIAPLRPTVIALRPFKDGSESAEYTLAALGGLPLSARPELWTPYETQRSAVLKAAKPVTHLKQRFPQQAAAIDAALAQAGRDAAHAAYLPLVARKATAWTVLLDAQTAEVIATLPLDSF